MDGPLPWPRGGQSQAFTGAEVLGNGKEEKHIVVGHVVAPKSYAQPESASVTLLAKSVCPCN